MRSEMSTVIPRECTSALYPAISAAFPSVRATGPGCWSAPSSDRARPLRVQLDHEWLVLSVAAPRAYARCAVLRRLPQLLAEVHPVKPVLCSSHSLSFTTEAPLRCIEPRILSLLGAALSAAAQRWQDPTNAPETGIEPTSLHACAQCDETELGAARQVLLSWLEGSPFHFEALDGNEGWLLRGDGTEGGRAVAVSLGSSGALVMRARLSGPISGLAPVCQDAVTVWAARANYWLRLTQVGLDAASGVEVRAVWPLAAVSAPICDAMVEAIVAAAPEFEPSAAALQHEAVAAAYLEVHRPAATPGQKGGQNGRSRAPIAGE